jgi:hypothetical protein
MSAFASHRPRPVPDAQTSVLAYMVDQDVYKRLCSFLTTRDLIPLSESSAWLLDATRPCLTAVALTVPRLLPHDEAVHALVELLEDFSGLRVLSFQGRTDVLAESLRRSPRVLLEV